MELEYVRFSKSSENKAPRKSMEADAVSEYNGRYKTLLEYYAKRSLKSNARKKPLKHRKLFLANRRESKIDKRLDLPENTQDEKTQNNLVSKRKTKLILDCKRYFREECSKMQEKLVKKQEVLFLEQNPELKVQKFRKEKSYKPLILYDFEL